MPVGETLAPITRLTIDRTGALLTTFSWTKVVSATFSWTKVVSATFVGRVWCHDLRADESAACPWGEMLAPLTRLTVDRTEALPAAYS